MGGPPESLPRDKLWLLPQPGPDEVFSSWVVRTAWANGLDGADFAQVLKAKYPQYKECFSAFRATYLRQPDRFESEPLPEIMAQLTNLCVEDFDAMRLWPGAIPGNTHFTHAGMLVRHKSELPLPLRHERSAGSFCPECLASGYYFRRSWRLALAPCCTVHRRMLLDECPLCHQSVEFYWHDPREQHGRNHLSFNCRQCGFDLVTSVRHPPDLPISQNVLALQGYFLAQFGWARTDCYYGLGSEYYMISRLIALIAKRIAPKDKRIYLPPSAFNRQARFYMNRQSAEGRLVLLTTASQLVCSPDGKKPNNRRKLRFYTDQLDPTQVEILNGFMVNTFPKYVRENLSSCR